MAPSPSTRVHCNGLPKLRPPPAVTVNNGGTFNLYAYNSSNNVSVGKVTVNNGGTLMWQNYSPTTGAATFGNDSSSVTYLTASAAANTTGYWLTLNNLTVNGSVGLFVPEPTLGYVDGTTYDVCKYPNTVNTAVFQSMSRNLTPVFGTSGGYNTIQMLYSATAPSIDWVGDSGATGSEWSTRYLTPQNWIIDGTSTGTDYMVGDKVNSSGMSPTTTPSLPTA